MAEMESKWTTLWKDFETARKSEWLKKEEVGNFNAMVASVPKAMIGVLKKMDLAEVDISNGVGNRKGKNIDDAQASLLVYKSQAQYLKSGHDKATINLTLRDMPKDRKPKTYRALKVLLAGIDEISSLADYKYKSLVQQVADAGKVVSSQERVAQVQALALDQVKKGAMKSLACLQKVKGTPTPAMWKAQMNAAMTRDLIMGLTSLVGAQAKGAHGGVPLAQPHKTAADPWNTGQARSSEKPTDTAVEINQMAKDWGAVVKAVVAAYQAHW